MLRSRITIRSLITTTAIIAVGLAVFVWATRPPPPIYVAPTDRLDIPVVAIFQHAGGMNIASAYHDPYCEFALWNDGTIVWRETPSDPNSRMLRAVASQKVIENLFSRLCRSRLLAPEMNWQCLGPDSDHVTIEIVTNEKLIELASWHEQPGYESYFDDDDATLLNNWRVIRDVVSKLTDRNGVEYNGSLPLPTPGIRKNGG